MPSLLGLNKLSGVWHRFRPRFSRIRSLCSLCSLCSLHSLHRLWHQSLRGEAARGTRIRRIRRPRRPPRIRRPPRPSRPPRPPRRRTCSSRLYLRGWKAPDARGGGGGAGTDKWAEYRPSGALSPSRKLPVPLFLTQSVVAEPTHMMRRTYIKLSQYRGYLTTI